MKEEREMYMIVRPDGSLVHDYLRYIRKSCIIGFGRVDWTWQKYEDMGYRCKKVKVTYEIIE